VGSITRREFVVRGAAAAAGATAAPLAALSGPDQRKPEPRPNLLIIHTDQQSSWTLGAYGGNLVGTPRIDSIGRQGAVLNQFFTNSAVCTPSRGCLVTGRYPHAHGAYRNNIELGRDEVTLAEVLRRSGYDTGYAGKWHLDGPPKPGWMKPERSMGFDDCRWMFNRGHWKSVRPREGEPPFVTYQVGKGQYTTDWLAERTIEFIGRQRSRPFFYMVSIPDPHTPFTVRAPYDTMYQPGDMPVPATIGQTGLPWGDPPAAKPAGKDKGRGRKAGRKGAAATLATRQANCRKRKAQYCGEVKCIDDNVGRILDALAKKGILDETVVVFTTDHGEYMGEHGLYGKNQLYETAYRIPFLVRWPKRIPARTAVDHIVSTVDVQPTLLGLMGIEPSGREQGRDASAAVCGKKADWADESLMHHSSLTRAGIFTPEYELAVLQTGPGILFDRRNDPEQVHNLYGDPGRRKVLKELTARVIEHHRRVKSPALAWLEKMG